MWGCIQKRKLGNVAKEGYCGDEVVGPTEGEGVRAGGEGGWWA